MLVASIFTAKGREVYTVGPHISLLEVTKELREKRVGAVLVTSDTGEILGVLSERDIVRAIASDGSDVLERPVMTFMTREIVTCESADCVDHVMMLMTDRRVRHIPVVDQGALVGLVSIGDVVKSKIAESEMERHALRSYIATG